jgi:hypothetical protein
MHQAELAPPRAKHCYVDFKKPKLYWLGQVKAQKLYDRFGPDLIKHIKIKNLRN